MKNEELKKPEKSKVSMVLGINERFWVSKINEKYDEWEAYHKQEMNKRDERISELEKYVKKVIAYLEIETNKEK